METNHYLAALVVVAPCVPACLKYLASMYKDYVKLRTFKR